MNAGRTKTTEQILTPEEVAAYLRLGRTTTYSLLSSGQIKSFKVGRRRLIRRRDVERFVDERGP